MPSLFDMDRMMPEPTLDSWKMKEKYFLVSSVSMIVYQITTYSETSHDSNDVDNKLVT